MADNYFTISEQKVLALTPLFSGFLSVLGSATILSTIWRDRKEKLQHPYHRIMVAMSFYDLITSLNLMVAFLAVPKGLFWGARGTTLTCEISGFLLVSMQVMPFYNFGVSVYYVLVIRYGKSQEFLQRYVEPIIHAVATSIPLGLGIWAWVSDAINSVKQLGGLCQIYEFPFKCSATDGVECTRGHNWKIISTFAGFGLLVPLWIGLIVAMAIVALHVRKHEVSVAQSRMNPETARLRQTCIQAMLYIVAYFVTYAFVPANQILAMLDIKPQFSIAVLLKVFLPFQGFLNFFIYIRPRYVMLKAKLGRAASFRTIVTNLLLQGAAATNSDAPELDSDPANAVVWRNSFFEFEHRTSVLLSEAARTNREQERDEV